MKQFGSFSELVTLVFREAGSGKQVTLRSNAAVGYAADRILTTPNVDANDILVSRTSTDTLTNKSISGASNTITGVPVATGISGLGTGVATFLATPSSANLAAALTDETGSGAAVFASSPTLVTPILGTPTSGTLSNCTSVKGITTGSAVAAGLIGEVQSSLGFGGATAVGTGFTALGSITPTAGVYLLTGFLSSVTSQAATNLMTWCVGTTSASSTGTTPGYNIGTMVCPVSGTGGNGMATITQTVATSGSTTYYLNAKSNQGAGLVNGDFLGSLFAVRIG
jgi:hypothetical protein